ncbi:MAG: hypothetical protein Ct9H90mP30_4410 [Actinomycetota bacterium]|nr:MAG: hypothetical protein Ct9H90mP30_4410 [Actinomycetota bacterium]
MFDALIIELSAIDSLIDENSHKWDLDRMPLVDLAILRIAVLELKHFASIPSAVIVSEAVELATKYSRNHQAHLLTVCCRNLWISSGPMTQLPSKKIFPLHAKGE